MTTPTPVSTMQTRSKLISQYPFRNILYLLGTADVCYPYPYPLPYPQP